MSTDAIRAIASQPAVLEAIALGAPVFGEILTQWLDGLRRDDDGRIRRTLVKFLYRMSWRPTPFGLFSGTTVGQIGEVTQFRLQGLNCYEKYLRLDFSVMSAVAGVVGEIAPGDDVRVRSNSSVYVLANQFRFVEKAVGRDAGVTYKLASVDYEDYIAEVLDRARDGAQTGELVRLLVSRGADSAEAPEFIVQMIRAGLLELDCDPPLIASDHLLAWRDRIATGPSAVRSIQPAITRIHGELEQLSANRPGQMLDRTRQLVAEIRDLPGAKDCHDFIDARLVKPADEVTLGRPVLRSIEAAIDVLAQAAAARGNGLFESFVEIRRFIEHFTQRYGDACVPLCEALDAENGIGYAGAWDREVPRPPALDSKAHASSWSSKMRRAVWKSCERGQTEVPVTDLLAYEDGDNRAALPDALLVHGRLAATDPAAIDADFRVFLSSVVGPSSVSQFGRYCAVDAGLAALVREQIARESATGDVVFAEVVHQASGRIGNVMARPSLTEYEIDYLGVSEARGPRRILVSDLLLSVEGGRLVLRSARLGREVIPRQTDAHATFQLAHLPLYRFLGSLKWQAGSIDIAWRWADLERMPFLPRVTHGSAVLALAQWWLDRRDLAPLITTDSAKSVDEFHRLRERIGLPESFCLVEHDYRILVDSRSRDTIEYFIQRATSEKRVQIVEQFPAADKLCVCGPEGLFVSDFMLPMSRQAPRSPDLATRPPAAIPRVRHAPGSDWLYAKVYAGFVTIDRLLLNVVAPLVAEHRELLRCWFFIRYADPEPHLRLRFRGDRKEIWSKLVLDLHSRCEPWLRNGAIGNLQIDTYVPETLRYGGVHAIELAERMARVDSDASIATLASLPDASDQTARRIAATQSTASLLRLMMHSNHRAYAAFATSLRDSVITHLHADSDARRMAQRRSSAEYRRLRAELESAMVSEGLSRETSELVRPIVEEYEALSASNELAQPMGGIIGSFLHMHCNRLFRSHSNEQELIVYDWIARWHTSLAARELQRA